MLLQKWNLAFHIGFPIQLKYNLQCRTKSCDSPKHKTFTYNFSSKQKESGKYKSENNIFSFEQVSIKWHQMIGKGDVAGN